MSLKFKQRYSFEQRIAISKQLRQNHPDKIPIIIERAATEKYLPLMKRQRFLVHNEYAVVQLIWMMRSYMQLTPNQTVYLIVNKVIINNSASLSEIYQSQKDEDGFLYVTFLSQNTFG